MQRIEYSKTDDNYRANFNNDEMDDEMERVMSEVLGLQSFGVSDFLTIYKRLDNPFRMDNLFTYRNTKHLIDNYLKYHKIEMIYSQRLRQ